MGDGYGQLLSENAEAQTPDVEHRMHQSYKSSILQRLTKVAREALHDCVIAVPEN